MPWLGSLNLNLTWRYLLGFKSMACCLPPIVVAQESLWSFWLHVNSLGHMFFTCDLFSSSHVIHSHHYLPVTESMAAARCPLALCRIWPLHVWCNEHIDAVFCTLTLCRTRPCHSDACRSPIIVIIVHSSPSVSPFVVPVGRRREELSFVPGSSWPIVNLGGRVKLSSFAPARRRSSYCMHRLEGASSCSDLYDPLLMFI